MADTLSPEQRSRRMSLIRGKNTKPEMKVRRLLHKLGYRYRLHARDLPGRPDLAFRRRRKVVLVHGCFWHHHTCRVGHVPATRSHFWAEKFERNVMRDARNLGELDAAGWQALVIWECETRDEPALEARLAAFLGPPRSAEK